MSLVNFNFESYYLKSNTNVLILLPDRPREEDPKSYYTSGEKYEVLWLLHGTFGDNTDWLRKSMVETYAREKNLILVMPTALNSNYSTWPKFSLGFDMYSFLIEELMPVVYTGCTLAGFGGIWWGIAYGHRTVMWFGVVMASLVVAAYPMFFDTVRSRLGRR